METFCRDMQVLALEGSKGWLPSGEEVVVMILEGRMGNGQDGEQGSLEFCACSELTSQQISKKNHHHQHEGRSPS